MDKINYEDLPSAAHEAVHAARNHAQAVEVAREVQAQNIGDIMQNRMEYVLAKGTEQDKSIILARVPYICQDIKAIFKSLEDIKTMMGQAKTDLDLKEEETNTKNQLRYVNQDQFWPIKTLAYGLAALILTGVVGALLSLVVIRSI